MDIMGKSPVPYPLLITGKAALFGCAFFFLLKESGMLTMMYDSQPTRILGVVLYIGGLIVILTSLFHLGTSAAVGLPERPTALRTRGLYGITRNPVYMGGFFLCAGSCLYAAHPLNFLLCAVAAAIHHMIVKREESFLETRFRDAWLHYRNRVPRYLGRRGS
jgi:protein-S-isoprenylcysteine O-methyltransferase Ste14